MKEVVSFDCFVLYCAHNYGEYLSINGFFEPEMDSMCWHIVKYKWFKTIEEAERWIRLYPRKWNYMHTATLPWEIKKAHVETRENDYGHQYLETTVYETVETL